jgi:glycosyltransferase involved in cell wall biosynthesis
MIHQSIVENHATHSEGRYPIVSFIVPCYKLAHFLAECVNSILRQSFQNFEVLIMDDCSPDDTTEIANSFRDPRVRYVRNERNVGHLRNYNLGIAQSRGKYVWLISADDRLRRPYILDRYVSAMEANPRLGMACCPGIVVQNGHETKQYDCGDFGPEDRIWDGREFIATSIRLGYGLLAPSVMVRKDCYDRISTFPLDMPHQGDWYLWFRWALDYDVAYFSEPMVNYRSHDLNIMKELVGRVPHTVFADEVNVLWRTRKHCLDRDERKLARQCEDSLTAKYARAVASGIYSDLSAHRVMSLDQCEQELRTNTGSTSDYKRLKGKFLAYLANQHWRHDNFADARKAYLLAVQADWKMFLAWLKIVSLLVGLGPAGVLLKNLTKRKIAAPAQINA